MSVASAILKIGVASVVVPALAAALGFLLAAVIPGCRCDEGAGCHGCGALNGAIAFLKLGGFVGAIFAMLSILPGSLLLAGIVSLIPGGEKSVGEDSDAR
jgi:hypothetical protein